MTGATAMSVTTANAATTDQAIAYVPVAEKGAAQGVATLDAAAKIPPAQIPDLSAIYAPEGGGRPVGKGELIVNVRDYGAVCNGIDDDSAALQSAIAAASGGVGIPAVTILIPGTLRITKTILIAQKGVTLMGRGIGNPSNFVPSPSAASVIRWDGPAGIPMFTITDSRFVSVENMLVLGNVTNRPSDGFYFNSAGGSIGTNAEIKFSRVTIGGFPWATPATPSGTMAMDNGIRFGGANANNDQMSFQDVVLSQCTVGLALPNSQSIWGESQNVCFNACGIGLKTSAQHTLYNATFNACGIDVQLDSTAKVDVWGWCSEGSRQIFNITGPGALSVDGAVWTVQAVMQGKANIAIAPMLGTNLSIRNVAINYQITPKPPLVIRGTYAVSPYQISIVNCSGLDLTTMDIQGYAAAGKTYVDISTQGLTLNTTITRKPLSTYIGPVVKSGNYTLIDGECAPLVTNGAAVTITLPDPTTVTAGRTRFTVKNIHTSNAKVVSAGTFKTIDGAASHTLIRWAKATYFSDGKQWLSL
ncbi:glycosyl hydrolase family 28-related protein [Arthrobacter sp. NPDC057009]|uniref:glycosyl hydrolase family 28-related protein n=1 Tax=Arthrobacter sp. NPDC057009 TaxID=3345996 RepID=UPI003642E4B3